MNQAERHKQVLNLFDQVCDLSFEEREAFLNEHCPEPALREQVESLLRYDASNEEIMDEKRPNKGLDAIASQVFAEDARTPDRIGQYKVICKVGEGGMGIIYEAEQESPRRRVAVKVLRPGIIERNMLKRFEHEAHVLGQLQHPGIAHIYEAGIATLPQGRQPFFVMEYIDGLPLDQYVKENKFNTRQKLEILARVCDAVQHAHQKGIIHRDLKPANILVVAQSSMAGEEIQSQVRTAVDIIGQPKVLDFGIARVTNADIQTVTIQTDVGQLVGTLAYMSPEQVMGNSMHIDTRCDIYALGVILYQLVTGHLPHDVANQSIPEAARRIREKEPESVSAMDHSLRGDVDTIIAKALDKDPDRRYATVSGLASDIRRYLNHEPIFARPPSTFYQMGKFARRNKGLVAGLATSMITLVVALVVTTYGLVKAEKARTIAERRQRQVEVVSNFQSSVIRNIDPMALGQQIVENLRDEVMRDETNQSLRADRLAKLNDALANANPTNVALQTVDANILAPTRSAVDASFGDQPVVRAKLLNSLGQTYSELGLPLQAEPLLEQAHLLYRTEFGDRHLDTLDALNDLAIAKSKESPERALEMFQTVIAGLTEILGAKHEKTLAAQVELARLTRDMGHLDEAEEILNRIDGQVAASLGSNHLLSVEILDALGGIALRREDFEAAEAKYRLALDVSTSAFPNSERVTQAHNNLGNALHAQGKHGEAYRHLREAYTVLRNIKGDDHSDVLSTLSNLGGYHYSLGQFDKALEIFQESYNVQAKSLGQNHPDTLRNLNSIGGMHFVSGRKAKAIELLRKVLAGHRKVFGDNHIKTLKSIETLGGALLSVGELEEANSVLSKGLTSAQQHLPGNHVLIEILTERMANCLKRQGQWSKAKLQFTDLIAIMEGNEKVDPILIFRALIDLSICQVHLDEIRNAEKTIAKTKELLSRSSLQSSYLQYKVKSVEGATLLRQDRFKEAEESLLAANEGLTGNVNENHSGDHLDSINGQETNSFNCMKNGTNQNQHQSGARKTLS